MMPNPLMERIMSDAVIISGYRSFIKIKTGNSDLADEFVEHFLREHHIDPVKAGFIPKRRFYER